MFRTSGITTSIAILFLSAAAQAQDTGRQPTARELFYQGTPAKAQPAKPAARPKVTPSAPSAPAVHATPPPQATPISSTEISTPRPPDERPSPQPIREDATVATLPVHVVKAKTENGPPLGLRYSIVRLVNGQMVEVSQDFVFHKGDHIQLQVQTNTPGYLYVVNKGASGNWAPIFPSPEIAHGDNHVDGFHVYTLPRPDYQISFDELTGVENVTIVFSRQPIPDFESLIYSLQDSGAPVSDPGATPQGKRIMVASINIDDDVVGRLHASTRDLIVEHVDPTTPADSGAGDKKETAVYVVNPAGAPDSRLVADLHLVHR